MVVMQSGELRARLPEYLKGRGLPLRKPFSCLNPAHEDRHPSMSYNARLQNVHCFSCGATYDLYDLIGMEYAIQGFSGQKKKAGELFGYGGGSAPARKSPVKKKPDGEAAPPASLPAELDKLRGRAEPDCPYIKSRGITAESVARFSLFEADGRAWFPIREGGACAGYLGRARDGETQPRYKNSAGPVGVFGGDYLRRDGGGERLFITEGVIDAILLEQMGCRAVSVCGSQNAKKLLERCGRYPDYARSWRFVACGDPDDAGAAMNRDLSEGLGKMGLRCETLLLPGSGDIAEHYRSNREALEGALKRLETDDGLRRERYGEASAAGSLAYFCGERERRGRREAVSTGFPGLDEALDGGICPGLYVLGAISSLGKTSLALQIADYASACGHDVLYFSLEQGKFELMAKSLSRMTAVLGHGCTTRELMRGVDPSSLFAAGKERAVAESLAGYRGLADCLFLLECGGDLSAGRIREAVRDHIEIRGKLPLVVVDYLQILPPEDARATDKQNIDRAVVSLRRLSRDFSVPVLVISSFNRENYRAAVSMEAFKESGAVEYSADVLMGIQLRGAGSPGFDVNAAKLRAPRQVELVVLKNRNGAPYAKIPFDYHAAFSLFQEAAGGSHRGSGVPEAARAGVSAL